MNIYNNLNEYLKYNKENVVIFCVANYSIREMVLNLVLSCKKNNIDILLVSLDKHLTEYMEGYCNIIKYYKHNINYNKFYKFGSFEFKDIVYYRFLFGNNILNNNKDYIYIDCDIVINKNFINDLNKYIKDNIDCLIQYNGTNCCTGFFYMRSTNNTKNLFTNEKLINNNYKKYNNDQDYFNKLIYDKNIINIYLLNRDKYPNGGYYYDNSRLIDNKCYLIHFNCIVGYDTKIEKMKKYNYWNI